MTQNGCSYSINEALGYGTKVIVTPLPYLNEIGINDTNAIICKFDMSNLDEVIEKIKNVERVSWKVPEDNYKKYLEESKSNYEELNVKMKLIKVKAEYFIDAVRSTEHCKIRRSRGEEYWEENWRADDLIERGFCTLVKEEEVSKPEQPKEKAVKEEKKEKTVKVEAKKEKAVKRAKK